MGRDEPTPTWRDRSGGQEPVIRALIERVARTSERCNHLDSCVNRIESKLDSVGEGIEEKFLEIDRILNGRLGTPGLVTKVTMITIMVTTLGWFALSALLFLVERKALEAWLGG